MKSQKGIEEKEIRPRPVPRPRLVQNLPAVFTHTHASTRTPPRVSTAGL